MNFTHYLLLYILYTMTGHRAYKWLSYIFALFTVVEGYVTIRGMFL